MLLILCLREIAVKDYGGTVIDAKIANNVTKLSCRACPEQSEGPSACPEPDEGMNLPFSPVIPDQIGDPVSL